MFRIHSEILLNDIILPKSAVTCLDINCKNELYEKELCTLYEKVVESPLISGRSLNKTKKHKVKPESGKPRHGPAFDYKKGANASFKYALRFIKRNENALKSESLARKLQLNSLLNFGKK